MLDFKRVFDFSDLTIGDLVIIKIASTYSHGTWKYYREFIYKYKGYDINKKEHDFINNKYEYESLSVKHIYNSGIIIKGIITDKIFLRKEKIKKLIIKKTH